MEGWKDSISEKDVEDEIIIELTIFKDVSIGSEFELITCCFVKNLRWRFLKYGTSSGS